MKRPDVLPWPFPGQESQLDRSRQVGIGYRDLALRFARQLGDLAERQLAAVDKFAVDRGEQWMLPRPDTGADGLTRNEAALRLGLHPDTVSRLTNEGWITRYPDGLYSAQELAEFARTRPDLAASKRGGKRQTAARAAELDQWGDE